MQIQIASYIFMTLLVSQNVNCQKPPAFTNMIFDFISFLNGKSIIIHADTKSQMSDLKMVHREISLRSYFGFITDSMDKSCEIYFENVDIHFIIYDQKATEHILACFEKRKKFNKETWVFITKLSDIKVLKNDLKDISLDLDDNVMVSLDNGDVLKLMEIYKISKSGEIQSNDAGQWSTTNGLEFSTVPKWYRRGNLQVSYFQLFD